MYCGSRAGADPAYAALAQTLGAAIDQVDAVTSSYPSYYRINCAHPTHFE